MLQKQTNSEQNTNNNQNEILEEDDDFLSGIIHVCELGEECESCQ